MANIKLNFLSLTNSSFQYIIYVKQTLDSNQKEEGTFVYTLPEPEQNDIKSQFLVSFSQKEGFLPMELSSFDNIGLTKNLLLERLQQKLDQEHLIFNFKVRKKFADTSLEFTIGEVSEGLKKITFAPYFLEEQKRFGFLVDYHFSKYPNIPFDKTVQRLSLSLDQNFRSNKSYYSDKYHLIRWFIDKSFLNWNKFLISPGTTVEVQNTLNESPSFLLSKKEYVFFNHNTAYSQFQGIKNYGPYEKINEDVTFVFLFEERFRSFANELYLSLMGKSNPGTFSGFETFFKIKFDRSNVKQVKLMMYDKKGLDTAIENVKTYKNSSSKVIGLYIEDYDLDEESTASNIYYYLKYHFIKEDIPLQVINYRKLGDRNSLKWSTSNIALAMFSKLGGIPWIVKPNNNNCLILGIGSSHSVDKETEKINKYFAYSVCLDSTGLYKSLEVLADEKDQDHYLDKLQNNLVALLKSSKFSNYSSCVLHLPFKIKKSEIQALTNAVKSVKDIQFVAVKINTKNKFFGFSTHNTYVPYESNFVKLSKNEYLVWFEGLLYGKEVVDKRMSNPVHIQFLNLHQEKNIDEKSFLQDILNLSGANWRGFNAKSIPISIYYSQIIAKYIDAFERLDDYNESLLSNERPWFL